MIFELVSVSQHLFTCLSFDNVLLIYSAYYYMHAVKFQVSKVKWKRLLLIQVSRSRWPLGTLDIYVIKAYVMPTL